MRSLCVLINAIFSAASTRAFSMKAQDNASPAVGREQKPIPLDRASHSRSIHANPITARTGDIHLDPYFDHEILPAYIEVSHYKYNSSWSRTYVANGSESMLGYNGIRAEGHLSQDTLYVAGLEIRDQLFHELVSYVSPPTILWTQDFDAVLGLAPFNDASFAGIQNPFQNMISQGLLDANIISLSLGGTTAGESIPGEIMYGGINYDLMEGELIRLLATQTRDADQGSEDRLEIGPPVLNGTWQVEVRGISWGDESAGENYEYRNLNGFTAILETASPWIILPPEISERLDQILEPEYDNPWFAKTVDCLKRDTLPALTFNLAGYNFTLSPYEYTIEVSMGDYGYSCVVAYAPLEREMVPPDEPDFIVLGSSFLRGFNSVFDFDRKEVGCT
ncbi:aspartic peptidase domain-containing protein [Thermoascus aurantiacus ATCC 26904]